MLNISFAPSAVQDSKEYILFDLRCQDIPEDVAQEVEIRITGQHMAMKPSKVLLRDVFDPAMKGAAIRVRGELLTSSGDAYATIQPFYKGTKVEGEGYYFGVDVGVRNMDLDLGPR